MLTGLHPDPRTAELEQLVEAHGSAVYAIAFRISGDRGAAEEIAQDVFVELWRARPLFASADHARYWLRRVAVHRATDLLRKRLRRPVLVADNSFAEHEGGRPGASRELSPCLANRLEGLLLSLPKALRATVVLRYGEDEKTPDEIAALLGQPVATVKSNLHRALGLLRRKAGTMLKEYARD